MAQLDWKLYNLEIRSDMARRQVAVIAPSQAAAIAGCGLQPKANEKAAIISDEKATPKKIPNEQLAEFFDAVADSMKIGLSFSQAAKLAILSTDSPTLRGVVGDIILNQDGGLDAAFARHPTVFLDYHVEMIKASAHSEGATKTFTLIAGQIRNANKLRGIIVGGSIKPVIAVVASLGVGMMTFLIMGPMSAQQYEAMDLPVPAAIRIVSDTALWIRANPWVFAIPVFPLVALAFSIKSILANEGFQRFYTKLPHIGKLMLYVSMSRSLRVVMMLERAKVVKSKTLAIAERVAANVVVATYFSTLNRLVHAKGVGVKQSGRAVEYAQAFVLLGPTLGPLGMKIGGKMSIAEETGDVAMVLEPICDSLDAEAERVAKQVLMAIDGATMIFAYTIAGGAGAFATLPQLLIMAEKFRQG